MSRADETALAGDGLDDALALELGVGLGDGIAIDAQLFGERPDRRQRVARLHRARRRGRFDLVDDLEIHGNAGFEIQGQTHVTVIGQYDSTGRRSPGPQVRLKSRTSDAPEVPDLRCA